MLPDWAQEILSLALTVIAAILYAVVLGGALIKTLVQPTPDFTVGTVRAAGLLSGLVGSVVTAGFARSKRPMPVQMRTPHPMGGSAETAWSTLKPPSLVKRNLLGLASMLGLHTGPSTPSRSSSLDTEEAEASKTISTALWVALLYYAVYFLIGIGALLLMLTKPVVPEIVQNSAWVWLGTVSTSGYSFFALDS